MEGFGTTLDYKALIRFSFKKINLSSINVFYTRKLYNKYNNVIIIDITYNINKFQMMPCVIIVIDNNYRTRIMICAIIENETTDTYSWIFDSTFTKTDNSSRVIFTDLDSSMI